MDLIEVLKNNLFLQNLAAKIYSLTPCFIEHNLGKYRAIKKAFFLTALEQLEGDYLEFGVFTGSSFVYAMQIHQKLKGLSTKETRFFGFDSFEGFGEVQSYDAHPFYKTDTFKVDSKRTLANIKKHAGKLETHLVKGFFRDSIKGKSTTDLGISKARVIFIDCDLKEASSLALEFAKPSLQVGTVLIMDDFFAYRGDATLGVCGAFEEFNAANSNFRWRQVGDYGYGGVVYVLSAC
ncbi:MAG: TylF/MycF family methyltransferase [Candidatus Obscuribacterales bacterium]|nr:TylF/MycF family methyltransferase [Candidatus Obscuribacterales bacterium]